MYIREEIHEDEIPEDIVVETGELLLPDVGFRPDTANIINESNAVEALNPYAEAMIHHLKQNPETELYLLGTTKRTVWVFTIY